MLLPILYLLRLSQVRDYIKTVPKSMHVVWAGYKETPYGVWCGGGICLLDIPLKLAVYMLSLISSTTQRSLQESYEGEYSIADTSCQVQ